jgi:metal-responsive CopG/Arc/MetJ family transcriptional regulator
MTTARVAITLDRNLPSEVDALVKSRAYPSRSKAIQDAVAQKRHRISRQRLARECAKLDSRAERAMAEEGIRAECGEWPEY